MKVRIACSVLAAVGAIVLTQTIAFGSEPAVLVPDSGAFGQEVGSSQDPLIPVALMASTCPDSKACFWKQSGYGGDRKMADSADAGADLYLGANDGSMKNRLANRRVQIKDIDGDVLDCINPGGERSNLPGRADIFKIGVSGSSC